VIPIHGNSSYNQNIRSFQQAQYQQWDAQRPAILMGNIGNIGNMMITIWLFNIAMENHHF